MGVVLAPCTGERPKVMPDKPGCTQLTFVVEGLVALSAPEDRKGLALSRSCPFQIRNVTG